MKIVGIYALYWEITSMVYIGQSQDIDTRFKEHISKLKANKHTNYKVAEHYTIHGIPELVILETCSIDRLNDLEIAWTSEFNSLEDGLNIIEAGKVGYGVRGNASKYTKLQILKVFRALYLTYNYKPLKEFAVDLGVNLSLFEDISRGKTHGWLSVEYPYLYSKMLKNKEVRNSKYKNYRSINGVIVCFIDTKTDIRYEVSNLRDFAKKHNLHPNHLSELVSNKRKSHKGFILA